MVLEAKDKIGGGTRTAEITLPGFHNVVLMVLAVAETIWQPS